MNIVFYQDDGWSTTIKFPNRRSITLSRTHAQLALLHAIEPLEKIHIWEIMFMERSAHKRTPKLPELAFVLRKRMVAEEGNGHRNEQGNK